jgi:glutamine synthetase
MKVSWKNLDYAILHFVDLLGLLKGRTIPAWRIDEAISRGIGLDGSSIPGFVSIEQSDVVMQANPGTFIKLPFYFYNRKVGNFICDILMDGEPFEGDPRFVCKRNLRRMKALGYEPKVAAEVEFYLVRKEGKDLVPAEEIVDEQRYFDISPGRDGTEEFRMDLASELAKIGLEIERHQHEVGAAQSEITFKYADPVEMSDAIIRYKFLAKGIASKRYDSIATFMPKPWLERIGSGMHFHLSLFFRGKNLFYDPNGYAGISQLCRYFIGGLLEHSRALAAIVAPTVNSYKRLVPGYEAPVYIAWARKNRSSLVRIPNYFPRGTLGEEERVRVEFRTSDPLCNPYLAFPCVLEAGLDGIKKKMDPGDVVEKDLYHLSKVERKKLGIKTLPSSLEEALEEWNNDEICIKAIGKEVAHRFKELKLKECKEYRPYASNGITTWEIKKYLHA